MPRPPLCALSIGHALLLIAALYTELIVGASVRLKTPELMVDAGLRRQTPLRDVSGRFTSDASPPSPAGRILPLPDGCFPLDASPPSSGGIPDASRMPVPYAQRTCR